MNKPSHEYCEDCKDWNGNISKCMEICGIPMDIIEEWEKYHAIGTPDECRAAVEKQKAKKVKDVTMVRDNEGYIGRIGKCPCCEDIIEEDTLYCNCGQKVDWSDEE